MNATEEFDEFSRRRDAERAAAARVTWRKVSDLTGGGWSGLGPRGRLVFVRKNVRQGYEYGHRYGKRTVTIGERTTLALAKSAAAQLLES